MVTAPQPPPRGGGGGGGSPATSCRRWGPQHRPPRFGRAVTTATDGRPRRQRVAVADTNRRRPVHLIRREGVPRLHLSSGLPRGTAGAAGHVRPPQSAGGPITTGLWTLRFGTTTGSPLAVGGIACAGDFPFPRRGFDMRAWGRISRTTPPGRRDFQRCRSLRDPLIGQVSKLRTAQRKHGKRSDGPVPEPSRKVGG